MTISATYSRILITGLLCWPALASAQPDRADPAEATPAVAEAAAPVVPASKDYTVNPGDVLVISVWKEPDLQGDVLVRPDGKFSFPLAGDIRATGRSVDEIREVLTERLSRFIPDLVVSVSAVQIKRQQGLCAGTGQSAR